MVVLLVSIMLGIFPRSNPTEPSIIIKRKILDSMIVSCVSIITFTQSEN